MLYVAFFLLFLAFCPPSTSKLTQSIIKDHMVSHYKKVYSAKGQSCGGDTHYAYNVKGFKTCFLCCIITNIYMHCALTFSFFLQLPLIPQYPKA